MSIFVFAMPWDAEEENKWTMKFIIVCVEVGFIMTEINN